MRILITAPYHEKAQEVLAATFGEIIYRPWKSLGRAYNEKELMALLAETEANAFITEHDHVTKEVIDAFPDLQFIGVCRGTPSNVAVKTATEHEIPVFHTPARNAQAVAEMFVANVITFLRNTMAGCAWLEGENWEAGAHTSYLQFKGNELAGKTIGMVGFGAIGQRIANMVKCFPCNIQFYDPYTESPEPEYKKTSLEAVFATSDIVSIHLPVTKQTEGMIDKNLISLMKRDTIFVNTARAVVVNRHDLLAALDTNQIRGAILDVFDNEPPDAIDYKIIHHPNVLATPHIAGATFEVEDHHAYIMNDALKAWFIDDNKNIKQLANKELLAVKS
jgi:D-3-phosphoglycerate dehydrogenase